MLVAKERYYSLDVFRGATVALMIMVNNPGSWSHIYSPLQHAPWHGCTPTDLVFPFFLFAVGNAMAFVMPGLQNAGHSVFWRKVLKRFVLIFLIGLFLNWSPFVKWSADNILVFKHWVDPSNPESGIRILGVLQRIAIAYLLASIIVYFTSSKLAFYIGAVVLLLYWVFTFMGGTPGNPYSIEGFVGTKIDIAVLGVPHIYKGEGVPFDPEGLWSTLPAVVQVLFGYLVGQYIQLKGKNYEMITHLLVAGLVLSLAGLAWGEVFPINKKIWSSSYVLYTSGLAMLTIGVMIYLMEMKNYRGAFSSFFDVFGKNPLFIFVLSGFLPRVVGLFRWVDHTDENGHPVYVSAFNWFYQNICMPISPDLRNGSLLYAVVIIAFYWLIAWWLNKKKIYIKV